MTQKFKSLDHAIMLSSANQQEGLMGTTYDHDSVAALDQRIRLVVEDIAYALLGEKAKTFVNFDAPPLGDPDYERAIAPCMEAAGHTVESLKKDKPT